MSMKDLLGTFFIAAAASSTGSATIVGSFQIPNANDAPLSLQSASELTTRTITPSHGFADTIGLVEGSVSIMAGQEVGTSSYAGVGYTTFQPNTRFQELTRFGNAAAGGLVVYDFDLSAYLAGKTIGSNNGDSAFSLDVNWDEQRNEPPENAGLWFISYNDAGAGLTLDTTDITTFAVGGNSSGVANYNLVTDATKYKPVLTLGDPGSESIDLSSDFAAIQAGDGVIRVAYLERAFRGDIRLLAGSGLVETIVPEPSTAALATVGLLSVLVRRRRRSC